MSSVFESLKELILQSNSRVMSKLTAIEARISSIESRLDLVQVEQMKISSDVDKLREVVVQQQKHIEQMDANARERYLIFAGVPEAPVKIEDDENLNDDEEKISFLCEKICSNVGSIRSFPIEKGSRIGH